jgi:ribonuclease I
MYVIENYEQCQFDYPTIHGLWPDPETTCTECTAEAFSEGKLSSLTLRDMHKYWPTCMESNTNEQFWAHEWSKVSGGRCVCVCLWTGCRASIAVVVNDDDYYISY